MVGLLDRTSSEPASYSPAPRAFFDLPGFRAGRLAAGEGTLAVLLLAAERLVH